MSATPIRVLIVDDSALVRQLLSAVINNDRDLEVVGTASDPYVARDRIKALAPDVITLDVEMPRMDGLAFLSNLMRLRPMPVVMISSLTERGGDVTMRALELGAFDFVAKPKLDLARRLGDFEEEIVGKLKAAHAARHAIVRRSSGFTPAPRLSADAVLAATTGPRHFRTTDRIVAIGASTGGTEAIRDVLVRLPPDGPGLVIAQHIPAAFSAAFARRLDQLCAVTVCEATDGAHVLPGHVYVAPGDDHLVVERDGARFVCRLDHGPPVNRHRPSVDVLFRSMANNVGPNGVGVLLTGMGDDGARGLLEMQQNGATTMAQDEASSVVWGMPGAAVRLGAADHVVPLERVAASLLKAATAGRTV